MRHDFCLVCGRPNGTAPRYCAECTFAGRHLEYEAREHAKLIARVAELEKDNQVLVEGGRVLVDIAHQAEARVAELETAIRLSLGERLTAITAWERLRRALGPTPSVSVVPDPAEPPGVIAAVDANGQLRVARTSEAVPEGLPSVVRFVLRKYEISNVGHHDPLLADALEALRSVAVRTGVLQGMPHERVEQRTNEALPDDLDGYREVYESALKHGLMTDNMRRLSAALGLLSDKHTADSVARIAIERLVLTPHPEPGETWARGFRAGEEQAAETLGENGHHAAARFLRAHFAKQRRSECPEPAANEARPVDETPPGSGG